MDALLIDDIGEVWSASSLTLRRNLGWDLDRDGFVGHAVVELGFVEIRSFPLGCQILFRPDNVSQKAIANLFYWLLDRKPAKAVLSTFVETWRHEMVSDRRRLMALLTRYADDASPNARFLLRSKTPNRTKLGRLIPVLREVLQQATNIGELRSVSSHFVGGRYTFFRVPPSCSRLVFCEMGKGYRYADASRHIGLTFEDLGDYQFGCWIAEAHHQALITNEPVVHHVDALVDWPRRGRVRTRYQRLILPFTAHDGSRWVLSTSALRNDINLRAKVEDEGGSI